MTKSEVIIWGLLALALTLLLLPIPPPDKWPFGVKRLAIVVVGAGAILLFALFHRVTGEHVSDASTHFIQKHLFCLAGNFSFCATVRSARTASSGLPSSEGEITLSYSEPPPIIPAATPLIPTIKKRKDFFDVIYRISDKNLLLINQEEVAAIYSCDAKIILNKRFAQGHLSVFLTEAANVEGKDPLKTLTVTYGSQSSAIDGYVFEGAGAGSYMLRDRLDKRTFDVLGSNPSAVFLEWKLDNGRSRKVPLPVSRLLPFMQQCRAQSIQFQ